MITIKCQSEYGGPKGDQMTVERSEIEPFPALAFEIKVYDSTEESIVLIDAEQAVKLGEALVKWGKKQTTSKPSKITGTL